MGEVQFRAESRADEEPVSFHTDGDTHRVVQVLVSRVVEDYASRQRWREYVVKTDGNRIYALSGRKEWDIRRL